MKCEYCGYEFNDNFCPNCGAAAPEQTPAVWQPPINDNPQQNNPENTDYSSYRNQKTYSRYYSSGVQIRSISSCIILTILTCGIYGILWFGNLNDEVNYLSEERSPTSGGIAFLLCILTCGLYYFYWAYTQGVKIDRAYIIRNQVPPKHGILFIVLTFIPYAGGLITYCLMQNDINNIA